MSNAFLVRVSWVRSGVVHKKIRVIQNSEAAPPCDTTSGWNCAWRGKGWAVTVAIWPSRAVFPRAAG